MKLIVFGATGGTGRHIVEQALAQVHAVTAFARRPQAFRDRPTLRIVQGDAMDPPRVEQALAGQEVALNALGPTWGSPGDICSQGTKNIIQGMRTHGVRWLIVETAYGASETSGVNLYTRLLRVVLKRQMDDKDVQEAAIRDSGLDWVIVRPPRLTNGPKRGTYKVGPDIPIGLFSKISRADVADFMLKQLTDERYLHQAVGLRY